MKLRANVAVLANSCLYLVVEERHRCAVMSYRKDNILNLMLWMKLSGQRFSNTSHSFCTLVYFTGNPDCSISHSFSLVEVPPASKFNFSRFNSSPSFSYFLHAFGLERFWFAISDASAEKEVWLFVPWLARGVRICNQMIYCVRF